MSWILLILASLFEVAWVASLKRIAGLHDFNAIGMSLLLLFSSVTLLTISCRTLPVGTAYP
ncbi:MAG: multidrug efflux SMR transporter, partial [Kordiimonas sp.]